MKINWKVRLKNPYWWAQMICAVVLPVLAYFGLNWQDMDHLGHIGRSDGEGCLESRYPGVGSGQRL